GPRTGPSSANVTSRLRSLLAPAHDECVGALVLARLLALGVPAPGRYRVRVALAGAAFAAAVRMVDRVHDDTSHRRADAAPAFGARLAVAAQVVLVVADLADRRAAVDADLAGLSGLEPQDRVARLAARELGGGAGGARDLAALAGLQLDVVDDRADRDVPQLHRVARADRRVGARLQLVADGDALRREDVAALAVLVEEQRDVRRPVRVVFQAL